MNPKKVFSFLIPSLSSEAGENLLNLKWSIIMNLKKVFSLGLTLLVGAILAGSVSAQKYGGTLVISTQSDVGFDPAGDGSRNIGSHAGHDYVITADVTKGPYGDGTYGFNVTGTPYGAWAPSVAESWEATPNKIVYHLRKGIKFRNKAPVNGRELDANDVLATWNAAIAIPGTLSSGEQDKYKWTVLDKYTIQVEWINPTLEYDKIGEIVGASWGLIPKEIEKGTNRNDWRNTYGSGPFYPTKYVEGSVTEFEKNPDYWATDPMNPGNSIPYLDKVRLVKMDEVAMKAGLATGKIDTTFTQFYLSRSDEKDLMNSNPDLVTARGPIRNQMLNFNITRKPFSDQRVRRAVMLAIPHEEMNESLYDGTGLWPAYPTFAGTAPFHISLEQMEKERPDLARMWGYDPEEAKRLLAEAGYPNGFKTNIITRTEFGSAETSEAVALYLSQVGIDMEIRVVDMAKMYTMTMNKEPDPSYTDMAWSDNGCINSFYSCHWQIHMDPRGPFPWYGPHEKILNSQYGQDFITMYDDFLAEDDPHEHYRKWVALAMWTMQEVWSAPLMYLTGAHFQQNWVHQHSGVFWDSLNNLHMLKYTWLDLDKRKQQSGRGANE